MVCVVFFDVDVFYVEVVMVGFYCGLSCVDFDVCLDFVVIGGYVLWVYDRW